ncbi:Thymidylate kinase [Thalassoglobus neptunius]|uniref:Thymidylate kinase n=1 Tax=Thalassoglobus neptunius TaxID=1938619 RepID=A0A5C5X236_9PLAN|nr:dTMP kinase [Thalassoglobus neptunius]TWT56890.1 Thymidylate kinase [Thalassoglobus neptunius]
MTDERDTAVIVAVEGIDGSGKGTQAKRLAEAMTAGGVNVELMSFPRYGETFFGRRVGDFLNGRFGELSELDPFLVSLLYSGDRYESREVILEKCRSAELVIFDRYVPSNIAHQTAKVALENRQELREWIEHIEYEIFRLPRPDRVILLDTPVDVSQELIDRKEKRTYTDQAKDLQESNVAYMQKVRDAYKSLADQNDCWSLINVVDDGGLRSLGAIAADVFSIAQSVLGRPVQQVT